MNDRMPMPRWADSGPVCCPECPCSPPGWRPAMCAMDDPMRPCGGDALCMPAMDALAVVLARRDGEPDAAVEVRPGRRVTLRRVEGFGGSVFDMAGDGPPASVAIRPRGVGWGGAAGRQRLASALRGPES